MLVNTFEIKTKGAKWKYKCVKIPVNKFLIPLKCPGYAVSHTKNLTMRFLGVIESYSTANTGGSK